ncbi:MAG: Prolyl oligopeptidase family [Bacteroidetes bacterium HLUCCA01]|nr:MAG: Prolyl oligopeptidase family [Bacteroidetes bacterium HLUCCA01]
MLKRIVFLPLLLLLVSCSATGQTLSSDQKQALDHADFDQWRSVSGAVLTPSGSHLIYALNPQEGDGNLVVRNLGNNDEVMLPRGRSFQLNPDGDFLVFMIDPLYAEQRQARIDGKRPSEVFDDTLAIYNLATGAMETFAEVDSYKMPEKSGPWLAFRYDRDLEDEAPADSSGAESGEGEAATGAVPESTAGVSAVAGAPAGSSPSTTRALTENDLVVRNLSTGEERVIPYVDDYYFTGFGERLVYTTLDKDSLSTAGVHVLELSGMQTTSVSSGLEQYRSLAMDTTATRIVFLALPAAPSDSTAEDSTGRADRDDEEAPSYYRVYFWQQGMEQARVLADTASSWLAEGWMINEHASPRFSHNGERLFFGTAPVPMQRDTTVAAIDIAEVDVWNWQDVTLQTVQQARLNQLRRQTYQIVWHIGEDMFTVLEDPDLESVTVPDRGDARYGFGVQDRHNQYRVQWEGFPVPADWYRVDVQTGVRIPIARDVRASGSLSPEGRFLVWFDLESQRWMTYEFETGTRRDLTGDMQVSFSDELNDVPNFASPYGLEGWTAGDRQLIIRDRYDLWVFDPTATAEPFMLTRGEGRAAEITFRLITADEDARHIPDGRAWLSAFHHQDKSAGVYQTTIARRQAALNQLWRDDVMAMGITKAREADVWTIRKSTFQRFPDVYITDGRFSTFDRVTHANPQQDRYRWGDVELFTFNSLDGVELEGLLYTPENFDPSRTYPMIVYFYERTSDRLHSYRAPAPSASTITPAFYTSRGYIVAMPDIVYKEGNPGRSAEDAVIGMTLHLLDRGFVDRNRIGLQGQSWGGYQIAHIITRTDMFAAAMAGAPVSNMVSAYGGIRWATGLNRQFQYERTQSRIGGTLWERPLYYVENSPIFFADRVRTPLLMMHNDADGAVPWYQGIEFFVALKRLNQPVWMLNYNGEAHNLRDRVNRKDLSRRMQQFFDHYLMDAPAPVWMRYGIPAVEKGVNQGFDLVEE